MMDMVKWGNIFIVLFGLLFAHIGWAQPTQQNETPSADSSLDLGFHLGNLLPNQVNGVTEIMGLGGVRGAYRLSRGSYMEAGLITGVGEGQDWKDIHVNYRVDSPVENFLVSAVVGGDVVYYSGRNVKNKLVFGGHVGGGLQIHLGGSTWFRGDMKFGFSPGTTLYIGFGLVWRLGGGGAGGGDA